MHVSVVCPPGRTNYVLVSTGFAHIVGWIIEGVSTLQLGVWKLIVWILGVRAALLLSPENAYGSIG